MGCQVGCQCRRNKLLNLYDNGELSTEALRRHLDVLEDVGLVTVDEAAEEWSVTHSDGSFAWRQARARQARIVKLLADDAAGIA